MELFLEKRVIQLLKESKLPIRLVAKMNHFGEFSCQWDCKAETLPEKLELIKKQGKQGKKLSKQLELKK